MPKAQLLRPKAQAQPPHTCCELSLFVISHSRNPRSMTAVMSLKEGRHGANVKEAETLVREKARTLGQGNSASGLD